MALVEAKPDTQLVVDLEQLKLHLIEVTGTSESASEDEDTGVYGTTYPLAMSETYRNALCLGKWDSTTILLEHIDQAEAKGQTLPYMSGFASV